MPKSYDTCWRSRRSEYADFKILIQSIECFVEKEAYQVFAKKKSCSRQLS